MNWDFGRIGTIALWVIIGALVGFFGLTLALWIIVL
jgi:hypothetical protein